MQVSMCKSKVGHQDSPVQADVDECDLSEELVAEGDLSRNKPRASSNSLSWGSPFENKGKSPCLGQVKEDRESKKQLFVKSKSAAPWHGILEKHVSVASDTFKQSTSSRNSIKDDIRSLLRTLVIQKKVEENSKENFDEVKPTPDVCEFFDNEPSKGENISEIYVTMKEIQPIYQDRSGLLLNDA